MEDIVAMLATVNGWAGLELAQTLLTEIFFDDVGSARVVGQTSVGSLSGIRRY